MSELGQVCQSFSFLLQTCKLFTIPTNETSSVHCLDSSHEGAASKIFTCCQRSKQAVYAFLMGPIKSLGKGHESLGQHVAHRGGRLLVFEICAICIINLSKTTRSTSQLAVDIRSLILCLLLVFGKRCGDFKCNNHLAITTMANITLQ